LLKFVPSEVFSDQCSLDLLAELMDNCVPRLNLDTGDQDLAGRLKLPQAPRDWEISNLDRYGFLRQN
jgi:hypothetical protein